MNQPFINKQHVLLTSQTTLLEKTLKDILKNNTQVLETKYIINLGQLSRIVPNIKRYI